MPAPKFSGTAGDAVGNVLPFRVGPWVSYEPPSSSHTYGVMDRDVDMDAPQISTLREEETPPPPKVNNPRFKVKLVVKDKTKTIPSSSAGKPSGDDEEGEEEEDDQEDQLIDDDDGPIPAASLSSKRKVGAAGPSGSSKRKVRKTDHGKKSEAGDGPGQAKLKEKVTQQPGALAPTMSWFQANPATEQVEDSGTEGRINVSHEDPDVPLVLSATPKKKGTSKKTPSKNTKTLSTKVKLRMPQMPPEDTVSEGMTGTAASSPIGIHIDDSYSPEPEGANATSNIPIDTSENTSTTQNPEQPFNLEGVPIPVYPLPNKPFPVLPPPKISSGFAPSVPLDKTKTRVRHWRVANREIRGIAGGRWFTRAWVGEKESEFASVLQAGKATNSANGVDGIGPPLGKIAGGGHSASAPPGGKGSKKKVTNSSRSGSSVPEVNGTVTGSVHGPSKMRISQMAPPPAPSSEVGDIDTAA